MTDYTELLGQLESDAPFRPEPPKQNERTSTHAYELPHSPLRQNQYSDKDLEGFLGFLVSLGASSILHTSTPLAARVLKDGLFQTRLDHYIDKATAAGNDPTDGAVELATSYIDLLQTALEQIIKDEAVKLAIRESFTLNEIASMFASLFSIGRIFERHAEADRPAATNILLGILMSSFKHVPGVDELIPKLEDSLSEQLGKLDTMDLDLMVSDPDSWLAKYRTTPKDDSND